jgi:tetratricopeptide (TPR) repeat protein
MDDSAEKSKKPGRPPRQVNTAMVNNLVTLIRSLTQAQKRDFKKFSQFYGHKNDRKYLQLFDHCNHFLSSKKDPEDIMTFIMSQKGFETRELVNSQARYLLDKILLSVRTMPEHRPRQQKLFGTLQDIQILYHKGLLEECGDRVEESLRQATQLNRHGLVLELLHWRNRLYVETPNVEAQIQFREEIRAEVENLIHNIRNLSDFFFLANRLHALYLQNKPMPEDMIREVREMLFSPDPEPFPVLTRLWKIFGCYYYYELLNRLDGTSGLEAGEEGPLENAMGCLRRIMEIFTVEEPVLREEEPELFNRALDNYTSLCIRTDRPEEVTELEGKLASEENELELIRTVAFRWLQYLMTKNSFEQVCEYVERMDLWRGLEQFKTQIPPRRLRVLYFTCGQAYFILEKYKDSVDWFNAILNAAKSQAHPQAALIAEMLICITQFVGGRKDMDPLLRNLRRRVKQAEAHQEVGNDLHELLRLFFRQPSPPKPALLHGKINAVKEKIIDHQNFHSFGLILAWMEARLNGTRVEAEIKKYNKAPERRA